MTYQVVRDERGRVAILPLVVTASGVPESWGLTLAEAMDEAGWPRDRPLVIPE